MAALSSFLPKVRMEADEAPTPVLEDAVRRAARHLCFNGWVYVKTFPDIPVSAGNGLIDLKAASPASWTDLSFVAAYNLYFRDSNGYGRRLDAIAEEESDMVSPFWRDHIGAPVAFHTMFPNSIQLAPMPDASGTLTKVRLVVQPEPAAATLPDILLDRYKEDIEEAAIAVLLMQRKKPWSNWQRGYRKWRNFEDKTKAHRRRVRSGNQKIALKVRIPSIT